MENALLDIKNLSVSFATGGSVVRATNGIDIVINKGQTVGLVGETGAGKTTTAKAILNLVPTPQGSIDGGEIFFEGEDLLKKSATDLRKIRGNQISMIFQDPMTALNPVITVGEQIAEVIRLHQKLSRVEADKKAGDMLEMVGIPRERLGEYPHQFSGGMKQRVVIAIALACNPKLLIADEPTTALDVTIQAQILELMIKLKEDMGTSMLMITHDLGIVAEICDKVAIIYAGEIVEFGNVAEIFENPSHPYTKGLFGCLPSIKADKNQRLYYIPGLMPDPTNLPKGCHFNLRCENAMPICSETPPNSIRISGEHSVKCHLFAKSESEEVYDGTA